MYLLDFAAYFKYGRKLIQSAGSFFNRQGRFNYFPPISFGRWLTKRDVTPKI